MWIRRIEGMWHVECGLLHVECGLLHVDYVDVDSSIAHVD